MIILIIIYLIIFSFLIYFNYKFWKHIKKIESKECKDESVKR